MSERQFTDTVESMATEFGQYVVTFVGRPGGYPIATEPSDVPNVNATPTLLPLVI